MIITISPEITVLEALRHVLDPVRSEIMAMYHEQIFRALVFDVAAILEIRFPN